MATNTPPPADAATGNPLRSLPSVNELADAPALADWANSVPRDLIVKAARLAISKCRESLVDGNVINASLDQLVTAVSAYLQRNQEFALPGVINATGILLHTGLGRSPLSPHALRAIAQASAQYTSLEFDLPSGKRGKRADVVRRQLCELTGAESATVVNNNAAAMLITLGTFATGKEVIVSRGELIELGGSFRLPEVMTSSGVKLREVGTTNKTRLADFETAIEESTGILLKVHPSNYEIAGFTESASLEQLVALGRKHNVPVVHDIGSGALFDLEEFGLGGEPVARESIAAGADLVLFSGDKLLGGPQAGIIVGNVSLIKQIEQNPLSRALRVGKLTLSALSATLSSLAHPEKAVSELPLWSMVGTPLQELQQRAHRVADRVTARTSGVATKVIATSAYLGGGSLPNQGLPSAAVSISCEHCTEQELANRLRTGTPPVVGRLERGSLILDLRAILVQQDDDLIEALVEALQD